MKYSHRKLWTVTDNWYDPSNKKDVRIGTWISMDLYKAGSLTAAARELGRYELDLVGVQKV